LSVADGDAHEAVALQDPAPADTVMSPGHPLIVGGSESTTVTVVLHVAEFPAASVAVNTTVLAPRFAHVKLVLSTASETLPHASALPPSTWAGVRAAVPDASSASVTVLHTAVGASSSTTVTFC
jgi:hypothetical protein